MSQSTQTPQTPRKARRSSPERNDSSQSLSLSTQSELVAGVQYILISHWQHITTTLKPPRHRSNMSSHIPTHTRQTANHTEIRKSPKGDAHLKAHGACMAARCRMLSLSAAPACLPKANEGKRLLPARARREESCCHDNAPPRPRMNVHSACLGCGYHRRQSVCALLTHGMRGGSAAVSVCILMRGASPSHWPQRYKAVCAST